MIAIQKGIYRHYKGNLYEVIDMAKHSETLEDMVVYRALYNDYALWVRPLRIFTEMIKFENKTQRRFEFIGHLPVDHQK